MVSTGWMVGSSRLSLDSDLADCVNTVITFYATSLSHLVGRPYKPPSLPFLARWWFDVSSTLFLVFTFGSPYVVFAGELRLAARTLFDAGVAGLTNEETTSLVERWQHSCTALALHRLVFELIWTVIQCRSYFRTLKDGHLSPQRVCCSVALLPLVNTNCSPQGDICLFDFSIVF